MPTHRSVNSRIWYYRHKPIIRTLSCKKDLVRIIVFLGSPGTDCAPVTEIGEGVEVKIISNDDNPTQYIFLISRSFVA
jgi:hypothetical protein